MIESKVLIIGAGAAGLACATKLLKHGFKNVFILESEARVGGRILTMPFADNVIDAGAQWCHGEKNNVVFEMANDKNLLETTGNIYVTCQCIRSNGEILSEKLVDRLKNTLSDIFNSRRKDMLKYKGSLDEYLSEKFCSVLKRKEFRDIDRELAHEFLDNFKKIESSESSGHVDEVSAAGFQEYWVCDGDYLLNWKDKGYVEFLKLLMEADPNSGENGILKENIITDMHVEQINWKRDDGAISVKCENYDEHFYADHVVVTVSLGVLKHHCTTFFNPELPTEKKIPIEHLGFGNVCKIFIEFPAPFWAADWTGFCTLWRNEDSKKIRGTNNAWLEDIFGFYCVNYQPRLLLGWLVGSNAIYMEKLQQTEILDGCMCLLRQFLPSSNIPTPLNVKTTSWYSNRNFRGAYSFRSMMTEKAQTSARALADPLTVMACAPLRDGEESSQSMQRFLVKPVVLFAGEATSDHYYSTVHGAVESGWREAERLINYYSYDDA